MVLEKEIILVSKTDRADNAPEGEITFTQVRRGRGDTEGVAHTKDKPVRVRRSVNQLHWINDRPEQDAEGTAKKLTRFKVALDADDPQYPKPNFNTL